MNLSYQALNDLRAVAGDAFYVFSPGTFASNLDCFQQAFRRHYANSDLAYAFKANYMPALAEIVAAKSILAEVVSRMEYEIAAVNIPGERIIFNGPLKRRDDLEHALRSGSSVNIDSFGEIDVLADLAGKMDPLEVGIRVSFGLGAEIASRFGFNHENGQLDAALKRLDAIGNLRVTGLHAHFSTRDKSLDSYAERTERMIGIAREYGGAIDLQSINVGGGYFGELPHELQKRFGVKPPSFEEYGATIGGIMKREFPDEGVKLIFEPGVSVVANCMVFVARILELRKGWDRILALCDASVNVTNPTRSAIKPPHAYVTNPAAETDPFDFDLVGNTCMEHDVMCTDERAAVAIGDWVVFANRGAYSNVYKPPFIAPAPPIVTIDGALVKRAETAKDVVRTYAVGASAT